MPFLPRSPGPFARAWRLWRRRSRHPIAATEQVVLLRDWHAALNQAAGETLYTSSLPQLFARAPYLEALRAQVEGMFDASWKSFYGESQSPGPGATEILDLLRRSAERERGVPC
jgi:mxaA protein